MVKLFTDWCQKKKKHFTCYLSTDVQVEPVAVFIQVQLMKHISGSRSIPGRFEAHNRYLFSLWFQLYFGNEQQTGPFLKISLFPENTFHGKLGI